MSRQIRFIANRQTGLSQRPMRHYKRNTPLLRGVSLVLSTLVIGTPGERNRAIPYRMKRYLLLMVFTFFILWRIEAAETRNPTAVWIPVSTYTDLVQCQQESAELNKNKPPQHPRRYVCLPDTIQPPAPT